MRSNFSLALLFSLAGLALFATGCQTRAPGNTLVVQEGVMIAPGNALSKFFGADTGIDIKKDRKHEPHELAVAYVDRSSVLTQAHLPTPTTDGDGNSAVDTSIEFSIEDLENLLTRAVADTSAEFSRFKVTEEREKASIVIRPKMDQFIISGALKSDASVKLGDPTIFHEVNPFSLNSKAGFTTMTALITLTFIDATDDMAFHSKTVIVQMSRMADQVIEYTKAGNNPNAIGEGATERPKLRTAEIPTMFRAAAKGALIESLEQLDAAIWRPEMEGGRFVLFEEYGGQMQQPMATDTQVVKPVTAPR